MSDKKLNNIEHADQNLLEQMVTEALMRDKMETPDVDMEWKRLAARMTTPSAEVETTSRNERLKVRFFSNRTLWMTIGSVAAIAFIIFLISLNLDKATSGSLYEARKQYAEIVVLDEQNHEQVINGNEIKLAPSVKVERHTVVVPEGKESVSFNDIATTSKDNEPKEDKLQNMYTDNTDDDDFFDDFFSDD